MSSVGYAGTIAHAVLQTGTGAPLADTQAAPPTPLVWRRRAFRWRDRHPTSSGAKHAASVTETRALDASAIALPTHDVLDRLRTAPRVVELLWSEDDRLAVIQLNDPDHFNSFSPALAEDMRSAVMHLQSLPNSVAVSLQGSGPHFSVGGNPYAIREAAAAAGTSASFASFAAFIRGLYKGFLQLRTLNAPITCAVHGSVIGGGLAACLHADHITAEHLSTFEHGNCTELATTSLRRNIWFPCVLLTAAASPLFAMQVILCAVFARSVCYLKRFRALSVHMRCKSICRTQWSTRLLPAWLDLFRSWSVVSIRRSSVRKTWHSVCALLGMVLSATFELQSIRWCWPTRQRGMQSVSL